MEKNVNGLEVYIFGWNIFIHGNTNSKEYLKILKENLKRNVEKFEFYEDNDLKYKSKLVREWLL